MRRLASSSSQMPVSGIRLIMDMANQIPDAIRMEAGQPNFPTPPHIIEAAHRAALDGYTAYTPNAGLSSLRELCAEKVRRENGIDAQADNIVVTVGSEGAVASAFVAAVEPGDQVLIPEPGWTNYAMLARARGAEPVPYPLREENGFIPDPEQLESLVTPRTKMLVVNSPANPTGAVYPEAVMRGLAELANRRGLFVLSDEAYEKLVFRGKHASPARFDEEGRVLTAFSFSKTYAMTGWRVGFAVASGEAADLMIRLQEPYYSCAPSVSQKAAEAALLGPQECVEEMVAAYARRQQTVLDILRPIGRGLYDPAGAFYILVDISNEGSDAGPEAAVDSFAFARRLLRETGVAAAPGATFGPSADRYLRLSVAASDEDCAEGARRLRRCLTERAEKR